MNILDQFGITGELDDQSAGSLPKVVSGRVAHIDADFMAYIIAADTVAETSGEKPQRSLAFKRGQVKEFSAFIARRAGADSYVLHLTPPESNKGGRGNQAVQAEYQGNRERSEAPADLAAIRSFMVDDCGAIPHLDQEADDGLAQANYSDPANAVLCSKDKDLLMVPGLHLDMDTGELFDVPFDGFGKLEVHERASGKVLKGTGPAFFFAQCLMGDGVDNIKGLPCVRGSTYLKLAPTKGYQELVLQRGVYQRKGDTGRVEKINEKIIAMAVKSKPCGPMMTHDILKDITNVKDAFAEVKRLFADAAKVAPFVHWNTGQQVTPTQALLGDMLCLWMRRSKNPNDAVAWLKEQI